MRRRVISDSALMISESGRHRDRRRGHDPLDRPVEHRGAVAPQAIDDVALRHDAGDAARPQHRHRADLALREQGDRVAHRRVAIDGQDLASLGLEDGGDGHEPLPSLINADSFNAIWGLDDPIGRGQMEAMPHHDPVPDRRAPSDFERAAVAWARYKQDDEMDGAGRGGHRPARAHLPEELRRAGADPHDDRHHRRASASPCWSAPG